MRSRTGSQLARLGVAWAALAWACLASAAEVFLAPAPTGKADGSSPTDARGAGEGGLQAAWDAMAAGDTLVLVSGTYTGLTLRIATGGTGPDALRTLCGRDTGGGLPVISGRFDRHKPDRTGQTVVKAETGASHWAVRDLVMRDVMAGVVVRGGSPADIRIAGLRVEGSREGVRIEGADGVVVEDCRFTSFTKRGVRLIAAGPRTTVRRCEADAGGRDWATEPFQMGFAVESTAPSAAGTNGADAACVLFEDCTARNSYNDHGKGYWNADGFCVEREVAATRYVRCRAFDCTDGGWDDKAGLAVLVDCVAARNKRNFRFWGHAQMTNCVSAFARHPGGSGGAAGVWTLGEVEATRCTFHGNPVAVAIENAGRVRLQRCLVSPADPAQISWKKEFATRIATADCIVAVDAADAGLSFPDGWERGAIPASRTHPDCGAAQVPPPR